MSPADVEVSPFVHARQLTRELAETDDPAQREVLLVGIIKVFESVTARLAMATADLGQVILAGQAPTRAEPEKKIDSLRKFMAAGEWRQAIALASTFGRLGSERGAILSANEAYLRPRFQRELGRDPDVLIQAGVRALLKRYNPRTTKGGE